MSRIDLIKTLRHISGAGIDDCKKALEAFNDDLIAAGRWLEEKGLKNSENISARKTSAGRVMSYIHGDGKVGVLLQVDAETDFVTLSDEFKTFMHELCLQIAAMKPRYIDRLSIPAADLNEQVNLELRKCINEEKSSDITDKIVAARLEAWFSYMCLLDQQWIKDDSKKVSHLLNNIMMRTKENIKIIQFSRFEAGCKVERQSYAYNELNELTQAKFLMPPMSDKEPPLL
jgi:elongation factor Ts